MSKAIKQMQMDALADTFRGVRDLVVLSFHKLSCQADGRFRAAMRKKNIQVRLVKNSYTRRVFRELGLEVPDDSPVWDGITVLAWGGTSVGELSRGIDDELRGPKTAPLYRDRVTVKGAVVDGQPIGFEQAVKMPTREEAIGRVAGLAMAPAARLVGQLLGPASRVRGQIKTRAEEKAEEAAPAEAASAPA